MNQGQQRFYDFILERVEVEDQEKAKGLLSESFAKQEEGTFNREYMMDFIPKMLNLIKPEYIEEVKNIMANHKA